jgi:hypothetical protein
MIIPLPETIRSEYSSHDMLVGPCSCGAWHTLQDWGFEFSGIKFGDLDSTFTEEVIFCGGKNDDNNL